MIGRRPTRDDPRRIVSPLIQEIGPRPSTSLAEAQAAAHVDAALRRVGMSVTADTFMTFSPSGRRSALLDLVGVGAAAVGLVAPLPMLLLNLWGLLIAIALVALRRQPLFARRGESQNVVATRPADKLPHWRVVFLARLDSPATGGALRRLSSLRGMGAFWRIVAFGALVTLQAFLVFTTNALWWYLQAAPAVYLLLLIIVALLPQRAVPSAAGVGALATMIATVKRTEALRYVELWGVALGATASGDGLQDFLTRYPFGRGDTFFVGLDQLDTGKLTFVTREGTLPVRYPDPYLLNLIAEVDAADPLIDAEPRPARGPSTLVTPLLARGYRAVTLTSYDHHTELLPPINGVNTRDPLDALNDQLINQAVRLLVGIVHKLDG